MRGGPGLPRLRASVRRLAAPGCRRLQRPVLLVRGALLRVGPRPGARAGPTCIRVYNGAAGVSSWDCYLKPALETMYPAKLAGKGNDISGLRQ